MYSNFLQSYEKLATLRSLMRLNLKFAKFKIESIFINSLRFNCLQGLVECGLSFGRCCQ